MADEKFWKQQLQTKGSIKNIMLDQYKVRGIGNAYADEILWKAGISPFSKGNRIPDKKIKDLSKAVKQVLKHAIKAVNKAMPGIIGGEIRSFLAVHNAHKKQSPKGEAIFQKMSGGGPTYYTKQQKLYA